MEVEVDVGSRVKIRTRQEEIEGTILESGEPSLVLVKLKSGYNMGIKKEDITDIEVLKQQKKKAKVSEIKQDKKLPQVDLIITGGTISSKLDYETGAVKWLTNPEELLAFYPELTEIVQIRKVHVPFMKASENMSFSDWKKIAEVCQESLNNKDVSGIIITHGTDFLHYTASALSFFLGKLSKPVVLTYSQRSSDRASSDARLNLICAAKIAVSDIAEVVLVGHGSINDDFCYVMRGSKVRKLHSSRRDAFKAINIKPIAKVFADGKIEKLISYNTRNQGKVKLDAVFDEKVALIKFYPGMDAELIDWLASKYKAIVIEASGLGHLAIDDAEKNLLPSLKRAINNGLIVCAANQTIFGRLDPLVYSPGRKLMQTGIIFLEDMLSETAYVKLGYVLGKTKNPEKIKKLMLTNMVGELNPRLEE